MADSKAQTRAQQDAARFAFEVRARRRDGDRNGIGMWHRDGYNVVQEQLNGEFDLDDPVARSLLQQFRPGGAGPSVQTMPSPRQAPPVSADWISDYLLGETPAGAPLRSHLMSAAVSPGKILGNTAGLYEAGVHARAQTQTSAALGRASEAVSRGAAQKVRVNEFMDVYNANKDPRGRPGLACESV